MNPLGFLVGPAVALLISLAIMAREGWNMYCNHRARKAGA